MLKPKEAQEKLKDRVTVVVAEKTGVAVNTLRRIKAGNFEGVTYKTMQAISAYFEVQDEV